MRELKGKQVILQDHDLKRREEANRRYLMKLTNDNLLFNYKVEAGRYDGRDIPEDAHGGDGRRQSARSADIFLGHWLSAAAIRYHETGDLELKLKADLILDELAECQKDNGGQWAAPIPEKYLHWVAQGKAIWAPQYNIHKLFMGLVDMHQFTGSQKALDIADRFADWFVAWSSTFTREKFDDILDMETGGMLEAWADLLELTGNEKNTLFCWNGITAADCSVRY
ncbi:beta-L-arabinofuranosidase domain-containing protein [Paenibacillus rhizoplanae]